MEEDSRVNLPRFARLVKESSWYMPRKNDPTAVAALIIAMALLVLIGMGSPAGDMEMSSNQPVSHGSH